MQLTTQNILGAQVTNATSTQILEYIDVLLEEKGKKYYIVTPNPEIITYATSHKTFQNIINNAAISLADGVGVMLAGKLLGKPLKERITGVDMLESICAKYSGKPVKLGFLGARDGIAELAVKRLQKKYPKMTVAFIAREWSKEGFINGHDAIDILFVAYGFPKQEQWIHEHLPVLPVRIMMGVGGSFDYLSGMTPRAPLLLRSLGLEWLFRLCVQPWRIKRQIALLHFIVLVCKEKLRG